MLKSLNRLHLKVVIFFFFRLFDTNKYHLFTTHCKKIILTSYKSSDTFNKQNVHSKSESLVLFVTVECFILHYFRHYISKVVENMVKRIGVDVCSITIENYQAWFILLLQIFEIFISHIKFAIFFRWFYHRCYISLFNVFDYVHILSMQTHTVNAVNIIPNVKELSLIYQSVW